MYTLYYLIYMYCVILVLYCYHGNIDNVQIQIIPISLNSEDKLSQVSGFTS